MKLESTMKAEVIAKGTEESRDGKTTYYRMTILQGMESGKLSCPEEVYHAVEKGGEYSFLAQYNDEYKSFRILGFAPGHKAPAPAASSVSPKQQ